MAVKISKLFFWTKPINNIIIQPFGWVIIMVFVFYIPFLRPWWWMIAPILLSIELRTLYLWWINWDYNYAKVKWVMLEIVPPKEVLVPLKAMEDIFTVIWPNLYNMPSWRERYCEGVLAKSPDWMSFEIASIEGQIHFYVRMSAGFRPSVESALYSHYPELEIYEVSDYTKDVPKDIPNKEWDVYGEDFLLGNKAGFPIKTYEQFFEPQGEKMAAEEKRIDPIASLLESMAKLGTGEQFWLQFNMMAMDDDADDEWRSEAKSILNKITKRPEKKPTTLWEDLTITLRNAVLGPVKDKDSYKWLELAKSETGERELVITPGEREVVTQIETKLKKPAFRVNIRGVYVAKRENWKPANRILTRSYFAHFQTQNMNFVRFSLITRPKTQYVFRKRIPFIRSRRMFRNYILRFTPLFPDRTKEMAIVSTEEMATIFHFPIKISGLVSPTMARVESKKGGPPPNLPT
ncbi:MAG TPA: hypothetical protein VE933_03965 [Chitinophagaceae bacterium]|nr:hypothetical protein [Chitinophagaceae bacterium]